MKLHSKALQCCLSTTLFLLISLDRHNSETGDTEGVSELYGDCSSETLEI